MGEAAISTRCAKTRPGVPREAADLDRLFERLIDRIGAQGIQPLSPQDNELIERTRSAIEATTRTVIELSTRVEALQHLALTDELTGVLNRRGFCRELDRAVARARRYGEEGAVIYVDIDDFKRINDSFGHAAGDAVLCHVARLLVESVRCTDHVGRLGGDEFAVLLSRATILGGRKRSQQLAAKLRGTEVLVDGRVVRVFASVGLRSYGGRHCCDAAQLLAAADEAMYAEKAWRRPHPPQLAIVS
jgi:diguanylate cyclase (GGDEF)-like protein